MNNQGGGAESDEVKELDDQNVLGSAEGGKEQLKDSKPEEPTVSGEEPGTEPLGDLSITREEQNLEALYVNLQEGQGQEQLLEKKKPPLNLLEAVNQRNARGLEQDLAYLGPGTMIHVKWPEALRKEQQSPWDTPWSYIRLTEEAQVSKPPEKSAWNWAHPTKADITGHIKLEPRRAWEIIRGVATKEQEGSRSDRNKDPGHDHNKLKAPNMTKVPLSVNKKQKKVSTEDCLYKHDRRQAWLKTNEK